MLSYAALAAFELFIEDVPDEIGQRIGTKGSHGNGQRGVRLGYTRCDARNASSLSREPYSGRAIAGKSGLLS